MTEKYYKWTAPGGQAPFVNDYRYPLKKLEELGMIELEDHSARAIKVVGGKWTYKAKGA